MDKEMNREFFDEILIREHPYVIAEVGSNYKSTDDLVRSVHSAKAAGADAVKFQYFTPGELYGPTYELDQKFPIEMLAAEARMIGIDFLCSAFSPEGVRRLDPWVRVHKIASCEMSHIRLLEAVRDTGKPLILSTGGYYLHDINRVLQFLPDNYPIILMHCNIKYPAKFVDLRKFKAFEDFDGIVGYSDHTTSIDAIPVLMTKVAGARVLEKHFNPIGYTDTPDAPHSLDQREFSVMVSYLREAPMDFTEENDARLMYVRRIIATKDIKPGDTLKEGENMGIFRVMKPDAEGTNPFAITKFEGKLAKKAFAPGDGISFKDLE